MPPRPAPLFALAAVVAAACAWSDGGVLPDGRRVTCHRAAAVADGVVAGAGLGVGALLLAGAQTSAPCSLAKAASVCLGPADLRALAVPPLALGVLFGASAAYSLATATDCAGQVLEPTGGSIDDRRTYAEWLTRRLAGRRPGLRFSTSGPDATVLVAAGPACTTPLLEGLLEKEGVGEAVHARGFRGVVCGP